MSFTFGDVIKLFTISIYQGMHQEFGSAGAVCSIEEISGPQNPRVPTVLRATKSEGAKGDARIEVKSISAGVKNPQYTKLPFINTFSSIQENYLNCPPRN